VIAHELGHNWGRSHAPCGTPDPDPNYPYAGGSIGGWGFDPRTGERLDPSETKDLMGYCFQNVWISDYTYGGVLRYRRDHATFDNLAPARSASVLVVSGSVAHEDDTFHLDPILRLPHAAVRASQGSYRLRVWDTADALIGERGFDTFELSSHIEEIFHVTLALPEGREIGRLVIERDGVTLIERRVGIAPASPLATPSLRSLPEGWVEIRWAAAPGFELLARDPLSGQLLGSDQGGTLTLQRSGEGVELLISDGLNTTRFLLAW